MPSEDNRIAAGIALKAPDGKMLFVQRGAGGDYEGHWCFPGGNANEGETSEDAARRELTEETGCAFSGDISLLETQSKDDLDYSVYGADSEEFDPTLDDENTAFIWAKPSDAPSPIHPALEPLIEALAAKEVSGANDAARLDQMALDRATQGRDGKAVLIYETLAFDRASVRTYDRDGRLHVKFSNISKANVCGYLGSEIPGWAALGLDPKREYQMLRDPEELEKAASSFNNIDILSKHPDGPVTTKNPMKELVIGSTGTDAGFDLPYLKNSLVFRDGKAIEDIEAERMKELSAGYYYEPDMTPGTYEGTHYDGVMRSIVANHVALVKEGRAGTDVVVGDEKRNPHMPQAKFSRKAAQVQGALTAYLVPKLAADSKFDLAAALSGITAKNFVSKKPTLIASIKAGTKLAKDASIDDLNLLLDKLDDPTGMDDEPDAAPVKKPENADVDLADDSEGLERVKEFLKGKISDEDIAKLDELMGEAAANDEDEDEAKKAAEAAAAAASGATDEDDTVSPAAMDAAIKKAVRMATDKAARNQVEIRAAEQAIRPYVGELAVAHDSAESVYRTALKMLGVDSAATLHKDALEPVLKAQIIPSAKPKITIATDAAAADDFASRFPEAARISA
jgi:8-oxo-dGTP pyrophosphatase MutT (NUDIX family)